MKERPFLRGPFIMVKGVRVADLSTDEVRTQKSPKGEGGLCLKHKFLKHSSWEEEAINLVLPYRKYFQTFSTARSTP